MKFTGIFVLTCTFFALAAHGLSIKTRRGVDALEAHSNAIVGRDCQELKPTDQYDVLLSEGNCPGTDRTICTRHCLIGSGAMNFSCYNGGWSATTPCPQVQCPEIVDSSNAYGSCKATGLALDGWCNVNCKSGSGQIKFTCTGRYGVDKVGTWVVSTGSCPTPLICGAGQYLSNGACTSCPQNTFTSTSNSATSCTNCEAGKVSTPGSTSCSGNNCPGFIEQYNAMAAPGACPLVTPGAQCTAQCKIGYTGSPIFLCDPNSLSWLPYAGGCNEAGCTPNCNGKQCGSNGCGSQCGFCGGSSVCSPQGQCVACNPSCTGIQCGLNACRTQSCGNCSTGLYCNSGVCGNCQPKCTGKQCGPDLCGGTCGTCTGSTSCSAWGQCDSCTPSCSGKQCGDDGCGGSCGSCGSGACNSDYTCVCFPDCESKKKKCGDNGCGGSCGTCTGTSTCSIDGTSCVGTPLIWWNPSLSKKVYLFSQTYACGSQPLQVLDWAVCYKMTGSRGVRSAIFGKHGNPNWVTYFNDDCTSACYQTMDYGKDICLDGRNFDPLQYNGVYIASWGWH